MEVTCESLFFIRERLYGVNEKCVRYEEIFVYEWSSMLWSTSFNKYDIKMWTNQINIVMETIGVCFLACRKDVSKPRQITSEAFDHVYGGYLMGKR